VTGSWWDGYCVNLEVENEGTAATTDWSAQFNTNGSTIYTSWSGDFNGNSGALTVGPDFSWNQVIDGGATNDSVGFCATRPGGSSVLPSVTSATGSY
jgi:hypothetical protein